MSGSRPAHLIRRGAIYAVRFRIPADLAKRVGMSHLWRSLGTSDPAEAKRRCLSATLWFRGFIERSRHMQALSRAELEAAARQFFDRLIRESERPRDFPEFDISRQIELSEDRIGELELALKLNQYPEAPFGFELLAGILGRSLDELSLSEAFQLRQLAVRMERERHRYFIHQLTAPGTAFQPTEPILLQATLPPQVRIDDGRAQTGQGGRTLGGAVQLYLQRKAAHGIGTSQHDEIARALGWLMEPIGQDRPIHLITKDEVVVFRDGLERLDVRLRGKSVPFEARQTTDKKHQIGVVTAKRYWSSTRAFFHWFGELSVADPSQGVQAPNGPKRPARVTPPFDSEELKRLFKTPLYAGHLSRKRVTQPGEIRSRGSLWWSNLIGLYTGMRAGEIAQLEAADYVFDVDVPFINVSREDESGEETKKAKTYSSIREIPISPVLLRLGLRQFVEGREKWQGRGRVMRDISLGQKDRKSDGLTKAWGRLLREHGLHKPGRSTHVWRHSVAHALREKGYSDEQIGQVLGHKPTTQTGGYGGANSLQRKLKVISEIDYGFDVVECLGGEYVEEQHWA